MVNHNLTLAAIKTLLDNDSTMNNLLKRKSDSKVFVGVIPDQFSPPIIQIVPMTDNQIDTWHDLSEITFYINVHVQNEMSGLLDLAESSEILDRANELIDDQEITVSGHYIFSMYVEGRNPAIRNPNRKDLSLEGLRCRMFAAA